MAVLEDNLGEWMHQLLLIEYRGKSIMPPSFYVRTAKLYKMTESLPYNYPHNYLTHNNPDSCLSEVHLSKTIAIICLDPHIIPRCVAH